MKTNLFQAGLHRILNLLTRSGIEGRDTIKDDKTAEATEAYLSGQLSGSIKIELKRSARRATLALPPGAINIDHCQSPGALDAQTPSLRDGHNCRRGFVKRRLNAVITDLHIVNWCFAP
ncbi:hypothetical protein MGWOODY_Hyp1164 [hydrothermal vent metagenome]|uniref:Uncharacterized protein n=1 Tax=hydrothermal vent metagenome TaxID=652676 RepID=A0A170PT40_9ZZZZ